MRFSLPQVRGDREASPQTLHHPSGDQVDTEPRRGGPERPIATHRELADEDLEEQPGDARERPPEDDHEAERRPVPRSLLTLGLPALHSRTRSGHELRRGRRLGKPAELRRDAVPFLGPCAAGRALAQVFGHPGVFVLSQRPGCPERQ